MSLGVPIEQFIWTRDPWRLVDVPENWSYDSSLTLHFGRLTKESLESWLDIVETSKGFYQTEAKFFKRLKRRPTEYICELARFFKPGAKRLYELLFAESLFLTLLKDEFDTELAHNHFVHLIDVNVRRTTIEYFYRQEFNKVSGVIDCYRSLMVHEIFEEVHDVRNEMIEE